MWYLNIIVIINYSYYIFVVLLLFQTSSFNHINIVIHVRIIQLSVLSVDSNNTLVKLANFVQSRNTTDNTNNITHYIQVVIFLG